MREFYLRQFSDSASATDTATAEAQPSEQVSDTQQEAVMPEADETQPSEPLPEHDPQISAEELQQRQRIADGRLRMQDWQTQGERMKAFYPSFSFQQEYNTNEAFSSLIRKGVSVRQAYEVTHLPQILSSAMQYAARISAEKTANAMRSGFGRPQENGLCDRKAVLPGEKGVENLTQTDIIRILERVGKGDKITF